jgi:hypothetical protein
MGPQVADSRDVGKKSYAAAKETVLKFASLPKLVRCLPVILLASVFVTIASVAQAWMSCWRIEEYPPVSNPLIRERIEAYLQALPAFKNYQMRELDRIVSFVIVSQDEDECRKTFRCHHLLLDVRNGAVKDVFVFRGTGTVWVLGSPLAVPSEPLHDDYSLKSFETDSGTYIDVRLPRQGGPVWIDVGSLDETKMRQGLCGAWKYK